MTSYQELTAKSKCSPPLKEVINLDPGGGSHPEVCSLHDSWRQEVEAGFDSPSFSLCTLSDSPPPPPRECEGLLTSAFLHSSGVPWRRRAQEQRSAGRGYSMSNEARHWCFGPHAEPLKKPQRSPQWDSRPERTSLLFQGGRKLLSRWEEHVRPGGKQQMAQTCVAVGPVMLVSADGKLHLCTGASPRAKRSPQIRRPGA
ncbi:hypothetical protein FQA47_009662 [Oryzias melastigma]|uniref:Uncharacterized protein n=1 Tax=Oryzias melastigma TaxID=30732 RepID=A0A834CDH4_ORYME|nr:hypothetical protein FQA47_009662 [Oryzias melastigma]